MSSTRPKPSTTSVVTKRRPAAAHLLVLECQETQRRRAKLRQQNYALSQGNFPDKAHRVGADLRLRRIGTVACRRGLREGSFEERERALPAPLSAESAGRILGMMFCVPIIGRGYLPFKAGGELWSMHRAALIFVRDAGQVHSVRTGCLTASSDSDSLTPKTPTFNLSP
jgi:hypothetical protein